VLADLAPVRPTDRNVQRFGDRALLVSGLATENAGALQLHLLRHPLPGQEDAVGGDSTVLIVFASRHECARAHRDTGWLDDVPALEAETATVEVPVIYDGEDLDDVARLTGLGRDGFVHAHSGQDWVSAFCGFSPGFAYLISLGEAFDIPRRNDPRPRIPAGAVAVGGKYTAVYPSDSPGGWQLIGHTDFTPWVPESDSPIRLAPGTRVRFTVTRERLRIPSSRPAAESDVSALASDAVAPHRALIVREPGILTLVQDRGRPGMAHLGIPHSGAADPVSAEEALALVGSRETDALLEVLTPPFSVESRGQLVVAVTGAPRPVYVTDPEGNERARTMSRPFLVHDGEVLELGAVENGARSYLAVRGGIDTPAAFGSRSADALSRIAFRPLVAGDILPIGSDAGCPPVREAGRPRRRAGAMMLRLHPGPHYEEFTPESRTALFGQDWSVGVGSNRVALRCAGPQPLIRMVNEELGSFGLVAGTVQVPPSGDPVLFLVDHPVTGGYPVIGVVDALDVHRLAQLSPGESFRFVPHPDSVTAVAFGEMSAG